MMFNFEYIRLKEPFNLSSLVLKMAQEPQLETPNIFPSLSTAQSHEDISISKNVSFNLNAQAPEFVLLTQATTHTNLQHHWLVAPPSPPLPPSSMVLIYRHFLI